MALMLASAGLAYTSKPTHRLADTKSAIVLERAIPKSFGDWHEAEQAASQIVNPQQQKVLDETYSQTLSKTYVSSGGYRIMLSIAYGGDQSRDLQVHRPEVCYSVQGFTIANLTKVTIPIVGQQLPAMHLQTSLGARNEPVTYWTRIGEKVVRGNIEQGFARLSYGIKGYIADGLLFRISSIDRDAANAYIEHDKFVADLMASLSESDRAVFVGMNTSHQ